MPTVQVRDFPQTLFEQLQHTAEREHRSVPQEVIAITESYINRQRSLAGATNEAQIAAPFHGQSTQERAALFESLLHAEPTYAIPEGFPSTAQLIREDRDAR